MRTSSRRAQFPIGNAITLEQLQRDPYPTYRQLQQSEPISWIAALNMYFVVRYTDVDHLLRDPTHFSVGTAQSTIFDTFGEQMLTVEDPLHQRWRSAFAPWFAATQVRTSLTNVIRGHTSRLLDGIVRRGTVDLRPELAARLPILTMLSFLGLPLECEADIRMWFDSFERALADFQGNSTTRSAAR
jgi:cytochrome P450